MRAWLPTVMTLLWIGCGPPPGTERPGRPRETFQQASAQDLFAQASARQAQGDFLGAEQYFAAAMERGYPAALAVKRLLEVCVASSRYQSALGYAQDYLADHPYDWNLRFLAATLQQALGNLGVARSELDRVIAEQPTYAPAYYALAALLSEGFGEPEAAIERYEQYLRLAPNGEHAVHVRAWLATYRRNHPPAKGVNP